MAGINRVIIVGNVGKDPEIHNNNNGDPIANLSIATSDQWKDKQTGEKREKTEWHRVVVFGGAAKIVQQYVKKGSRLGVEGKLQTRKWQDNNGNDRWSTEIVIQPFGGQVYLFGDGGGGNNSNQQDQSGGQQSSGDNQGSGGGNDMDDEIPF